MCRLKRAALVALIALGAASLGVYSYCRLRCHPTALPATLSLDEFAHRGRDRLVARLGMPAVQYIRDLRELDSPDLEVGVNLFLQSVRRELEKSGTATQRLEVLVWQDQCACRPASGFVAVVDPENADVLDMSGFGPIGSTPTVVFKTLPPKPCPTATASE